jgi:hypothetical protein
MTDKATRLAQHLSEIINYNYNEDGYTKRPTRMLIEEASNWIQAKAKDNPQIKMRNLKNETQRIEPLMD